MKKLFLVSVFVFLGVLIFASDDVLGKWKTVDDNTGEVKSIVEIVKKENRLYGTIIQLFNENPAYDPLCSECKGKFKNKKIIGLQIINGLQFKDGRWVGNKGILDPDNGKFYNVKMWVDEDDRDILHVRGYITFLYRTQTWYREK